MTVKQINDAHRAILDEAEGLLPGRWRFRIRIEQRTALPDVRFHWIEDGASIAASPWYVDVADFQEHIEDIGGIIDEGIDTGYYRAEQVGEMMAT